MIYTSAKVTIKNNTASIDNKILLYRGDKNIEIQIEIVDAIYKQYKQENDNVIYNMGASYAQLFVKKPDGTFVTGDIIKTKNDKIIFVMPEEMINDKSEIGNYSFQIRLFDETKASYVTIPPVIDGIVVQESFMEGAGN